MKACLTFSAATLIGIATTVQAAPIPGLMARAQAWLLSPVAAGGQPCRDLACERSLTSQDAYIALTPEHLLRAALQNPEEQCPEGIPERKASASEVNRLSSEVRRRLSPLTLDDARAGFRAAAPEPPGSSPAGGAFDFHQRSGAADMNSTFAVGPYVIVTKSRKRPDGSWITGKGIFTIGVLTEVHVSSKKDGLPNAANGNLGDRTADFYTVDAASPLSFRDLELVDGNAHTSFSMQPDGSWLTRRCNK
jgi:hypothetical protein